MIGYYSRYSCLKNFHQTLHFSTRIFRSMFIWFQNKVHKFQFDIAAIMKTIHFGQIHYNGSNLKYVVMLTSIGRILFNFLCCVARSALYPAQRRPSRLIISLVLAVRFCKNLTRSFLSVFGHGNNVFGNQVKISR